MDEPEEFKNILRAGLKEGLSHAAARSKAVGKPGLAPAWACYGLSLIAGFVFGFILYAVISRIPVYRWLVLGIKKKG